MLITLLTVFAMRRLAERQDKAYATFLGLLVGLSAHAVLSGFTVDSLLDRLDRANGKATTSHIGPP